MEKQKEKETRSESTESDSGGGGAVTSSSSEEIEEEEVEKLEEEIGEMGEKLYELRSTLPSLLNSSLSSLFSSSQPQQLLSLSSSSLPPSPSGDPNVVLSADDGETVDEIQLLREKISSNITAMPGVLKRMKDCISRLDKLVSSNETIHPAFKRKKI